MFRFLDCRAVPPHVLLAAFVAGCGDNGAGPDAVRSTPTDVTGTYSITATISVATSDTTVTGTCRGTIVIASQSDEYFSGSYEIAGSAECLPSEGLLNGSVDKDRNIIIQGLTKLLEDQLLADPDCILLGDDTMTGTLSGDTLTVQATRTVRCEFVPGPVIDFDVTVLITGTRT